MSTTPTVIPGGAVWVKAMRLSKLDPSGYIIPGTDVFVTDTLMKSTVTLVNETGAQIAIMDAAGNLGVFAIKGDIPKWGTVQIDLVTPDPQLEALLCGGTVFNDSSAALGVPSAPTAATRTTLGTLAAGTYQYAIEAYNQYGATVPSTPVQQVTTGSTSRNVVSIGSLPAGSLGAILIGRTIGGGGQLKMIQVQNIGSQSTSAASGTGSPASIAVTALTKPVPLGTQFTIAGDTNTPNIVFTVSAAGAVGDVTLAVTQDIAITTTIATGAMHQVIVDDGSVTPSGVVNVVDTTGGPGLGVGQQAHSLGVVPNPYGVGIEMWMERIIEGAQAGTLPYVHFVMPRCANFVVGARDFTNAELAATYTGNSFANPNFGTGPNGDCTFDTSEIFQWEYCGAEIVPTPSVVAQPAGF
jgi:hypothetical protein